MAHIPYGRQSISEEDIAAVVEVLRSDFLTQGPAVPAFERAIASYAGAQHAVAVNSATSALHIACLALGLERGDRLWTSSITFLASANCGRYCGAEIDFVDIDPRTYNMSTDALERKLVEASESGRLPKIVVPVHLCGQSCDMATMHRLAGRFGFRIIEDASHAIGGLYRGQPVGNCQYSDITIFSFHPVKVITSGEGGMALTNDKALHDRMSLLRSHGMTRDPECMRGPADGPWYYEQIALGFNYRMTDIQAALGHSQARRLDDFVARRHELAQRYDRLLADLPVTTPWQHPDGHSGLHLYVIRLQLARIATSHLQVFEALRARGIGVNVHYIPVHLQPYYRELGFRPGQFPHAEAYYADAISLPMHCGLTEAMQDQVVQALRDAMAGARR